MLPVFSFEIVRLSDYLCLTFQVTSDTVNVFATWQLITFYVHKILSLQELCYFYTISIGPFPIYKKKKKKITQSVIPTLNFAYKVLQQS